MSGARAALRAHWPEYLMEAAGLGLFMVSACVFGTLLEHPDSALRQVLPGDVTRRALMGVAMGLTAVALIDSPWGRQSGAHLNPAVTLTFLRLGKVRPWDAVFYALAQLGGGLSGVLACAVVLGPALAHPQVHYVVTAPGAGGVGLAFVAELLIAFVMMTTVLAFSNSRHERFTGVAAATLVALFILFEAPLSGMSLNPARTLASAVPAGDFGALWIYLVAPPLGMLAAAEARRWALGLGAAHCAKLRHDARRRCIFCELPAA